MDQEGVMTQRRKFSAEYKREAVAMLEAPEVTVPQIAADWALGPICEGDGDGLCAVHSQQTVVGPWTLT